LVGAEVGGGLGGAVDDDTLVELPFDMTGFGGIPPTGVEGELPPNPETVDPCGVLRDGRFAAFGGANVPRGAASKFVERLMMSLPCTTRLSVDFLRSLVSISESLLALQEGTREHHKRYWEVTRLCKTHDLAPTRSQPHRQLEH
jgi:hypothetical protein